MTLIPRPLVESIFASLVLFEYTSNDEIESRVAVQGMEDIVHSLQQLSPAEQQEFLTICTDVGSRYQGKARTEIPQMIAESLGLAEPS